MIHALVMALTLGLAALVGSDESLASYGAAGKTWVLTELDGAEFQARATLDIGAAGQINGQGPCNRFSASQTAPYPWFALGPIAATRRACPDLQAETAYFAALGAMTLSEVNGTVLLLSNDAGRTMVFIAE